MCGIESGEKKRQRDIISNPTYVETDTYILEVVFFFF